MRRALLALLMLTAAAPARADDLLVEAAEEVAETKEKAKKTLGAQLDELAEAASGGRDRAVESARNGAEEASERARKAALHAKQRTREAADSMSERAREATENAKSYVGALKEDLGRRAQRLGEDTAGAVSGAKSSLRDTLQGIRDQARQVLLDAATALDNKAKDARNALRAAHWSKLQTRYRMPNERPSMLVSEELRDHEYRLARLERARDLAEGAHDEATLGRIDRLSEREYARHRRRMSALLRSERKQKQQLAGELPDMQAAEAHR